MAYANYLDTPLQAANNKRFNFGGITELYLIPKSKLGSLTTVKDAFGAILEVTGIVPATGATFQEIDFKEEFAGFTDDFKRGNNKYMVHTLNFTVEVKGKEAIAQAHQLYLNKYVALVKEQTGLYFLVGLNGLVASEAKNGSGAKADDAATLEITMSCNNPGHAPQVTLDDTELAAIVTRLAA